jgi:glycosyltransferase involved in cell wall biosynthesis
LALDDPEGLEIYRQIQDAAKNDPAIHLFTNLTGVGNIEINVQKSIREGFGLVVSETLWKETPVVAGRAGGIPLQMRDGAGWQIAGEWALFLEQFLIDNGVQITAEPIQEGGGLWQTLLFAFGPALLLIGGYIWLYRRA